MKVDTFENKEPIVFVDGGSKHYNGIGFKVGDGDSSISEMDEKLDSQKDYSDLAYTLGSIPDHYSELSTQGFLGGRKDHELINWGEFFYFLNKNKNIDTISLENNIILYSPGSYSFDIKKPFSLINSLPGKIKITGDCDYQYDDYCHYSYSSQFLSNSGNGEINIESNIAFAIIIIN